MITNRHPSVSVPVVSFIIFSAANLSALWFGVYKILPVTLTLMSLLLLAMFRPVAPVSLKSIAPVGFSLLAVYLYSGLSTIWTPDPELALRDFIFSLLAIVPALLFGYFLGSRFTIQEICIAFGAVPVVYLIHGVFNEASTGDAMLVNEFSVRSLLGSLLCLIVPLLLGAYLQRPRVVVGFTFLVALILTLSIQSRGAYLIVGPAVFFVAYQYGRRAFTAAVIAGVFFTLFIVAVNPERFLERFSAENTSLDISEEVLNDAAKQSEAAVDFDRRFAAFTSALLFQEHPLRGGGYSSVLQITERDYGRGIASHGFIPGTAGELGLIGLSVIALFFYRLYLLRKNSVLKTCRKQSIVSTGFWSGLAALSLYGLFHQTFESAVFGVAVGIAFGSSAAVIGGRSIGLVRPL